MIRDAEEFIRLRRSENSSDYLRAANDNAPLEVWRDIIARHSDMRRWVAHNKTIPLEILAILADDPSSDVRHMVAMKNKLPPELMLLLVSDRDVTVRQRLAYNTNTPVEVLRKLAADDEIDVAAVAQKRLADLGF